MKGGCTRRDRLTLAAVVLLTLALCAGALDIGHGLGDDFAGYLLEGRAIARGTLREQTELNALMHPSERSFGDHHESGPLVYALGLPVILSWIFRALGCARPEGYAIVLFKLPGLLSLVGVVAVSYLFYRRRFGWGGSLTLTLLLAFSQKLLSESNQIMTDIPCMLGSMLALLLLEAQLDERRPGRMALYGVALGLSMVCTCAMRLNGVTVVYIVLLGHAMALLTRRAALRPLWRHALPYGVFLGVGGLLSLVFPAATSNTAHIASGANAWILYNIRYYHGQVSQWVQSLLVCGPRLGAIATFALYGLTLLGMLTAGIRRHAHLIAYVLGTFAVVYLLPYVQELRYFFNILPLMLLFSAHGAAFLARQVEKRITAERTRRWARAGGCAALILLTAGAAWQAAAWELEHFQKGGLLYRYGAYSEAALDAYEYIRRETPEDARIGCFKPRMLTLNTDRICFYPGVNGNRFCDADYLLLWRDYGEDAVALQIWPELWDELTLIHENQQYCLFQISEEYLQKNRTE